MVTVIVMVVGVLAVVVLVLVQVVVVVLLDLVVVAGMLSMFRFLFRVLCSWKCFISFVS